MNEAPKSVGAIFDAAIELLPERRAAFVLEACGGDDTLRQRVEALLRAHDSAQSFMDKAAVASRGEPVKTIDLGAVVNPNDEAVGQTIGRYKLLEKVGEGGCGVVYVAQQNEPVRRRVALKVIKLGMDSKEVIARFEAERQALAMMDHPNIAKVFDAGTTETGRPYFVMELVRGIKITEYCDQNQLNTKQRLALLIEVCHAVQHAHQKGIIHRDIKPSNIMVTLHDGVPVPKVIDFGIAKATEGRLTDETVYTQLHQFIGTPAYMSPEQAEMSGLDIDTRSDIYSLGVLLYELLAGSTPFDAKELMSSGLDAMRKIIREQEPVRPSTRFLTLQGVDSTTTAKRRSTDTSKLFHQLRGDLDWIVMKCLEKDRTRRYETANGLALDILRHINNEPVLARPPSQMYRFQKMVRRNKLACVAAGAVALALLLGVVVSALEARRARQAEGAAFHSLQQEAASREKAQTAEKTAVAESEKAKSEAERAGTAETLAKQRLAESEAISKFLTEVFQSPDPGRKGRTITVAETLGVAAKKLDIELTNQPPLRAKLQATLGSTYYALGLESEAIPLQERVRDYYLTSGHAEDPDALEAMSNLATSYSRFGRSEEALKLREQVLLLRRKVSGPQDTNTLFAMNNLANSYLDAGREDEALKLREEVLDLRRKVSGPEDPMTLFAMINLAGSYTRAGRYDEAIKLGTETLALLRKVLGPEHPETLQAMQNLAACYLIAGRRNEEALNLAEQAVALEKKVFGPEHRTTIGAMLNLEIYYSQAGRPNQAIQLAEETLALCRKMYTAEHPLTLRATQDLAACYDDAGRREEALKLMEQVLPLYRKVLGPEHLETLQAMQDLATCYAEAGRQQEAIALLAKVCEVNPKDTDASLMLATWQTWFGQDANYEATRRRLVQQADGTDVAGTADRAAKAASLRSSTDATLLTNALHLAQRAVELGKNSYALPSYQLSLGLAEYRSGQYAAAERSMVVAEQTVGDHDEIQGIAHLFHAMTVFRQDRAEEARKIFSQAEQQVPPLPKDENKPSVDGRPFDNDLQIWWLAYKEAKSLLNNPATAQP
jgi:serine/threonine protein kinase